MTREDIIQAIKIKHALVSYNFAVSQDDISQIKTADRLLIGNTNATYKFNYKNVRKLCI